MQDRFCTRCGKELPEGASFCPDCGAPVDSAAAGSAPRSEGFCTRCGAIMPAGSDRCPECGAPAGGGYGPQTAPYGYSAAPAKRMPGFVILFLLYGVFALVLGSLDAINAIGYDEAAYNSFIDSMDDIAGYDVSDMLPEWSSDLPLLMCLAMVFMAVSGALAIGTYYECRVKSDWKTATILCAASSVACLGMMCSEFYMSMGILMFVIGIIFTVLLYSSRNRFGSA